MVTLGHPFDTMKRFCLYSQCSHLSLKDFFSPEGGCSHHGADNRTQSRLLYPSPIYHTAFPIIIHISLLSSPRAVMTRHSGERQLHWGQIIPIHMLSYKYYSTTRRQERQEHFTAALNEKRGYFSAAVYLSVCRPLLFFLSKCFL